MVLQNRAMRPLSKHQPSHVSVQGPWNQHRGNLIPLTKKNKKTEGLKEREKGRKEKSRQKKDKGNWPKCHLASTRGKKKGGGKRKKEAQSLPEESSLSFPGQLSVLLWD